MRLGLLRRYWLKSPRKIQQPQEKPEAPDDRIQFDSIDNCFCSQPAITVVGGGILGSGIAAWLLLLGQKVYIVDLNPQKAKQDVIDLAKKAATMLQSKWPQWDCKVHMDLSLVESIPSADLSTSVQQSWLVIEAVNENLNIKANIFREAAMANPSAVFVTNSLNIEPSAVCRAAGVQEGLIFRARFLYPVMFIPYLEITEAHGAEQRIKRFKTWLTQRGMIAFASQGRLRIAFNEIKKVQDYFLHKVAPQVMPGFSGNAAGLAVGDVELFKKTDTCVVCWESEPEVISIGACIHVCLCGPCASKMSHAIDTSPRFDTVSCPMCRQRLQPAVALV